MPSFSRGNAARLLFSMVLVTLIANSVLSYLNLRRLDYNTEQVDHTNNVLLQLKTLQTTIIDAETGQRGYLLTGKESYLEPYTEAATSVDDELKKLEGLIADNPNQLAIFGNLQEQVQRRMTRISDTIAVRAKEGFDPARQMVENGIGKQAMDAIRTCIREMEQNERRLLLERDSESQVSYWTALISGSITSTLGLAMIVVGYVLVQRDVARREATSLAMQKNLERLEEHVRERTAQITEANAFLRDEVIERRRAELESHQMAQELKRSNRELEQFASVASHDLQEPLRKIQTFGDRLQAKFKEAMPPQAQEYVDRMLVSATRMRRLIDDLLEYSRVTTRSQPFSHVDLQEIGWEVSGDLEARLQQSGGEVVIGDLPEIDADPAQMRRLFQNLIGNALKFQKPDLPPIVEVSGHILSEAPSSPNGELGVRLQCEIVFQDNGIGFEQTYVDRIFELFQRLHGREEYEGTGMGLAICRKIVERHGGTITAQSSPGKGARFIVRLPVHQSPAGVTE